MTRVLVIDDDDNLRSMLRLILESLGFEVLEAGNGDEGLDLFKSSGADAVITDLIMPGKEGLETIVELRKINPGLLIIAMTGGQQANASSNLRMARYLGARSILVKPFSADQLAKALGSLLPGPAKDAEPKKHPTDD
jgi:DNA-binding response OmpR family regulator